MHVHNMMTNNLASGGSKVWHTEVIDRDIVPLTVASLAITVHGDERQRKSASMHKSYAKKKDA